MSRVVSLLFLFVLQTLTVFGQSDHYDNAGKIYTVVAVVCITLIGIAAVLFYLERRIKSLEEQINNE